MKWSLFLLTWGCFSFLGAESTTFSKDRLEVFYDQFVCEEKDVLAQVGLSSTCFLRPFLPLGVLPTPPPPIAVLNPAAPTFVSGKLPVVIVNNSGLPDTDVFILVQGRVPVGGPQVFVDFDLGTGVGTNYQVVEGDNGSTYTHPLSDFPVSGSGRVFYLSEIDSFITLISLGNALNIPVLTGDKIADPAYNNPADPYGNYTTNWDQFEGAYVSTGTNISIDATAVSFFSLPLYLYLSTPDPGSSSNCGLTQSRSSLMSYLQSAFSVVPHPPESTQWGNLVLKNGSTVYRVLSPGDAMAGGFFDINYFNNAASYEYSYLFDIWTSPISFYRRNPSSLSIKIPNGLTYTGTIQSDNSIVFQSGSKRVVFGPPTSGPPYTSSTSYLIYSGLNMFSSATDFADGVQVSKAFQEAIIAGIVPTTSLINASTANTLTVFRPYYQVNSSLTGLGPYTGPWYSLYAGALHACGSIYAFAYDEPLWPEVLLESQTLIPNSTYIGVTIGNAL